MFLYVENMKLSGNYFSFKKNIRNNPIVTVR